MSNPMNSLPDPAPSASPPATATGLVTRSVGRVAGGLGALIATSQHALREMGALRSLRVLSQVNQAHGFDCPGCAWPDPAHRSVAEFCENGAKAVAEEATTARITPEFFAKYSVADLLQQSDLWLGRQGRLTQPMVLRPDARHYSPIGWDEAFELVAAELNGLASADGAAFYTSGRTSNEAAFLYQLFVRQFGTNNLPDCSNMCHESSGTALTETLGIGKGTVTLEDFDLADAILVIGQNPGTNHPRMLTSLQAAARRGATIVSVNPLKETGLARFSHPQEPWTLLGSGTPLASLFVQVRVGGDVAFLQGVSKAVLEAGTLDHGFIAEHTSGFEAFRDALQARPWPDLVAGAGVGRDQMQAVADLVLRSKNVIACWAMGLTQHKHAVANIQEVVNLLLLGGHMGRPGAGACPVRGHSNVQGDRTMGIWEKMPDAWLDRLGTAFDFTPPRHHGLDTVATIRAMQAGKVQAFFGMGGNFLAAAPDTDFTAAALRNCRLTAHVSTKLNRSHLVHGRTALILPCLGRTEIDKQAGGAQFVTVENSMGVVHPSRGALAPASRHLRSEPAIVAGLARAVLGSGSSVDWPLMSGDYDRIRDQIARVVPGFEDFNARVRRPGGIVLPNGARDRTFRTATGKARFTVHIPPQLDLAPGQLRLMTLRSHDQYNTTIYGLDDRYRGVLGERRVVFVNAEDLADRGLAAGQRVDLVGHFEGETRVAERFLTVAYDVPKGCAAAYFPEANVLVPVGSVAEGSGTPTSKSIVITLRACQPSG